MAYNPKVTIADLRWPVTLQRRNQVANSAGSTDDQAQHIMQVHAGIEAVGAATFWGATATTEISHKITIRFVSNVLDNSWVVLRTTTNPDGTTHNETYRVRRVKQVGGKKQFQELECMLEGLDVT